MSGAKDDPALRIAVDCYRQDMEAYALDRLDFGQRVEAEAALYTAAIEEWHRRETEQRDQPRGPAVYLDMGTAED